MPRLLCTFLLAVTALRAAVAPSPATADDAAAFLDALTQANLSASGQQTLATLRREFTSQSPIATVAAARALLAAERTAVRAAAREHSAGAHYRIGISYEDPSAAQFDEWALFGLNFFRTRVPLAPRGRAAGEEQIASARATLDAAADAGLRAIFAVGAPVIEPGPADIVFTHEFLPSLRPSFQPLNFNSAALRDAWTRNLTFWASRIGTHPALAQLKIGNEPFWSTQPWPILGYDPATLGCSPEAWQRAVAAAHATFAQWRARWPAEIVRGTRKNRTSETVPWTSFADIAASYAPGRVRGLTFVDFLRQRHGTLEALNTAWFGADRSRHVSAWEQVLPPVPETFDATIEADPADADIPAPWARNGGRLARPRPADIAAWVDWTDYWPHAVADLFAELRTAARAAAPGLLATTSASTAHFINDYNANAISTAMTPWIGPAALDSVGLDSYTLTYWQAYLRACRSAAGANRRMTVLEAGGAGGAGHSAAGADPRNVAFVALFSFAWGADDVLFWRRDKGFEPRLAIEVLRAQRAIAEPALQTASTPVTDGVILVYPHDATHVAAALHGRALPALARFQSATGVLTRLQSAHAVLSDREIATRGVPADARIVWLPGASAASAALRAALEKFLARGGRLIVDDDFSTRDERGRPVPAATRAPLLDPRATLVLDGNALAAWRRSLDRGERNPRLWWSAPLPAALAAVGPLLASAAPPACALFGADGSPAPDYVAARAGDGALWAFVGPWAGACELRVRGAYTAARDTYRGADLAVLAKDGAAIVRLPRGPAVVRFSTR